MTSVGHTGLQLAQHYPDSRLPFTAGRLQSATDIIATQTETLPVCPIERFVCVKGGASHDHATLRLLGRFDNWR